MNERIDFTFFSSPHHLASFHLQYPERGHSVIKNNAIQHWFSHQYKVVFCADCEDVAESFPQPTNFFWKIS